MIDFERLPINLEETLKLLSENPNDIKNLKDMRELLRMGYLKIPFGSGWQVTNRGKEYLHAFKECINE